MKTLSVRIRDGRAVMLEEQRGPARGEDVGEAGKWDDDGGQTVDTRHKAGTRRPELQDSGGVYTDTQE